MKEFILIMPEIILALTLAFAIIAEITYHGEETRWVMPSALLGLATAFVETLVAYQYGPARIFNETLSVDGLSLFFKLTFILLAGLSIVSAYHSREIEPERKTEYTALVLAGTLGMALAASSTDLLLTFLALQFLNILGHFISGYGKKSVLSVEAGVKYMVFSAVAGALLLYGFGMLFAATHTLNIHEIHQALVSNPLPRTVTLVSFMLVFLSLAFQFAAFPMHFWSPDVLEGAPTPASAFLSVGSRVVGFAVAIRFFVTVFAQPSLSQGTWQVLGSVDWTKILGFVAGVSMLVGSLLALRQTAAKRMVGCLVIFQTGFMLLGLLVLDQVGVAALLYNVTVEVFAVIGIFYVLAFFHQEVGSDRLEDLKGMLGRAVPECICLVIFLLCLVGIPPSPGFIGKFTLIGAAVRHQWIGLSTIAVIAMTVSMVAVARLAFHLIGDIRQVSTAGLVPSPERRVFLAVLLIPVIVISVFAESILGIAGKSLGFILW